jgi:hypothetical protein
MAELKTKKSDSSVEAFLHTVEEEQKRKDCFAILKLMQRITGEEAKMWGPSIVGFGTYHYKYKSGREGDFFLSGFAPRKQALTLYIIAGFGKYDELMLKLGKHKTGKSCLYIKKLEDVDLGVLEELITLSVDWIKNKTWN